MAQIAATDARQAAVRQLAGSIVNSQNAEITVLEQMLAAKGGPVADL